MRGPRTALLPEVLAANARIWAKRAGCPVRAVIKSDGYGFGATEMIAALDDAVAGYVVADLGELLVARAATRRPIAVLGITAGADLTAALAADGRPNVLSEADVDRVAAWQRESGKTATVRVGVRPALGWTGVTATEAAALAPALARCGCEVEAWTHVTDASLAAAQEADLLAVTDAFGAAGVRTIGCDVASTAGAVGRSQDVHVRIGIGLFGVRLDASVPGLRCAIEARAAVVQSFPATGEYVGYGIRRAPKEGFLAVLRIGYGDGFSRAIFAVADDPSVKFLSVGMQYTVISRSGPMIESELAVVGRESDLDALARAAGCGPHEFVVRLGTARRNRPPLRERG